MSGDAKLVIAPMVGRHWSAEAVGLDVPWTVLYLGSSFADIMQLRDRLPAAWILLPTGDLLNAALAAMRGDLIELDRAVLGARGDCAWWDATHLAERNPLASAFLLNVARLAVARQAAREHRNCLILSDDIAFAALLYRDAWDSKRAAGWLKPGGKLSFGERLQIACMTLLALARGIRVRFRAVAEFLKRRAIVRDLRRAHPLRQDDLRGADVLLVSWADAATFPAAEPVRDGYLPGYADSAQASGLKAAYLVRAMPAVNDFRAVAEAAVSHPMPAVLLEELVSRRQMMGAVLSSFLSPWRLPATVLARLNVGAVLRLEALRELASSDAIFARLHLVAAQTLAALGVAPHVVIAPYENQPWEKLLRLGMRRHSPASRLIGAQHAPFAYAYLSFFPSAREVKTNNIPDRLLLSGKGFTRWFTETGFPADRLTVTGAPRFAKARMAKVRDGNAVLCCTGIELEESVELAAKAALACRGLEAPLIVNYHPATDASIRRVLRERVAEIVTDRGAEIRFVEAPVSQLLDEAAVVLHSTSAAAFDALFAGKPAIYVRREVVLDQNKVPPGLTISCGTTDELRAAIVAAVADGKPAVNRASALDEWVAPVSEAAIAAELRGVTPAKAA